MRTALAVVLSALGLLASPVARAEDEPSPYPKHLEAKAPSIAIIKFVRKVGNREQNVTETGVVVDPVGVVMLRSSSIRPGMGGGSVKVTVANLRVIFPGDEREYDSIVGATDTRLGLAFVRIKDLAGKKIEAVDISSPTDTKLGDELFGVARLEQGFDYAPYVLTARIAGQVTKPRLMWVVTGSAPMAQFLYFPDGKPAGVVISQTGVTEGGDEPSFPRPFLLPMKTALATIQQAIKASETALKEDAERAKETDEAGAATAGPTPPSDPAPATPPGMDAPK